MDRILAQDQLGGFGSEHDNYRGFPDDEYIYF